MVFIERCIDYREKATSGRRNLQICGHLRCRFAKNSPRRTTSTPAGVFCTLLASAPSICKRRCNTATDANVKKYTSVYIAQHRHGWRWFQTVAMFWLCQNSRPKVYKDVHFKTDTDVRGSMQRRVFAEQKPVVEQCTRRYIAQQR